MAHVRLLCWMLAGKPHCAKPPQPWPILGSGCCLLLGLQFLHSKPEGLGFSEEYPAKL